MKKFCVQISLLATVFLLAMSLFSIAAAGPTVIKIAHPNVPQHPMGQCFEKFKELVEQRSDGKFRVDIYDSSKFGNFDSVVQGLQFNMLQMGSASTPNLSPFSDSFLIYDLPFLFPDYESTDLITDGPIGMEAAKALESSGIIGLGYIEIGFRNLWNNKKAIKTMADAKGLKIRSTPSKAHIATLRALGMNPTPISWGEVYTALQQKTVDGIDIDLNLAWFNNFPEVNNNVTIVNSLYSPHLVMISKKFLDSLSEDDKKMILDTFQEVKLYERKLIRDGEKEIMDKLADKGVNVITLSPEERAKWAEATSVVYEEFEARIGKELIEKVRATIAAGK
jgi:tripartite ATP-independent transporter DctP family solute receptor